MTESDRPLYQLEDNTPLYSIEDAPEAESEAESEAEGFDADEEEETEPEAEGHAHEAKKAPSPLRVLFKTMLTPVEGWKALKRAHFSTDTFAARCFYPLIALAAVADCSTLFYEANRTMADWAISGLATFVTFFFGYFTIIALGGWILPKKSRYFLSADIGRQFVMLCLSTLTMFSALIQLLPMLEPVLVFLPLWTIYLIFKGVRVLRIPTEVENSTTGYLCLLIIGIPILWHWLLTEFLL